MGNKNRQNSECGELTAPYNFVPLPEEPYFPEWAKEISLERPIEGGLIGELEVEIRAESPIIVGGAGEGREENPVRFFSLSRKGKREFLIPGSSIRGMVREVVEIITFSKFNLNFLYDERYFYRDLQNKELREKIVNIVRGGVLYQKGGSYFLEDWGKVEKIKQTEIPELEVWSKMNGVQKYLSYLENRWSRLDAEEAKRGKIDILRKLETSKNGKKGFLVFTAQPSPQKKNEFIFFPPKNPKTYAVSEKVIKDLRQRYFEGRKKNPKESEDWKFWRKFVENGYKIPVFFLMENGEVTQISLSYLPKIPYKHSIYDCIPESHKKREWDFAEALFGIVDKEDGRWGEGEQRSLKGRVHFSHFRAEGSPKELKVRGAILSEPKGSYYPTYLEQSSPEESLTSYDSPNCRVRGWKRYPIRRSNEPVSNLEGNGNQNIVTYFKPLPAGTKFRGKIRFFNLRPAEVGALISALTFHQANPFGTNSKFFHNLGLGKPLGYGKISITIKNARFKKLTKKGVQEVPNWEGEALSSLISFEKEMKKAVPNWEKSDQLIELYTMATPLGKNESLKYPPLECFNTFKKEKFIPYTSVVSIRQSPSLLSQNR